jgi:phospholipase C
MAPPAGGHQARNGGLWDNWVPAKTEETMGCFTRDEIPFQYALAGGFRRRYAGRIA